MNLSLWLAVIATGLLTYATRLSFILLLGRIRISKGFRRALEYVPVAALSAITLPELVLRNGALALTLSNARLVAGLLAVAVAWRTRNPLLTIAVGMGALWLLQALALGR